MPDKRLEEVQKHKSVNLIRLKQTAEQNTLPEERNEKTAAMIKRAEKDFAMDLPLLVEKTARDTKILDAIVALETGISENIFYPYQPHREHLETRFGLLFYNDKIVIPEAMRSTIIAMLNQGHVRIHQQNGPVSRGILVARLTPRNQKRAGKCPRSRAAGKNLKPRLS